MSSCFFFLRLTRVALAQPWCGFSAPPRCAAIDTDAYAGLANETLPRWRNMECNTKPWDKTQKQFTFVRGTPSTSLNSPPLCFFLLFYVFLQVISLLRHTLDFLMTQFELFSKKRLKKQKKNHISSYYKSTFMTLLILPAWSVSGILWAHLHTNTSDALITGFYLLMVHNTTCRSMKLQSD